MEFKLGQAVKSNNDQTKGQVVAVAEDRGDLTLVQVKWKYGETTWFRAYRLEPRHGN